MLMMKESGYKTTIGLEIHAELNTQTKMFCNSKNDGNESRPNVNICPICMGYPGTLPVINKEAVSHVLKVGVAVGGKLADFTEFDRKNYFYPDIPKGYQISQYKHPLVEGGVLGGVAITRVHLEEDTARSSHHKDHSLVDFNRAGVPLMELVTEPNIHSAEQAVFFAKELQLLLRYLGVSSANMEKGEMRVEANISISRTDTYGTKTEVKNLNSFRSVERAILFEVNRQMELLESGNKVVQETRGWDENKQITFSQRAKEDSHDYRYFPEPDLPKLYLSEVEEFSTEHILKEMPELPWEKRERLKRSGYLKDEFVEFLVQDEQLGTFFDEVSVCLEGDTEVIKLAANYVVSDVVGIIKNDEATKLPKPLDFSKLMQMAFEGKISSRGTKDILFKMMKEGGEPEDIANRDGLLQKSNEGELEAVVAQVIKENSDAVNEYKSGKEASLQYLVGQGMKVTKGSANPQVLLALLRKNLTDSD
jgi:aspartyl-tRNA(Asn)/glutamyl-tRNA(Gln) amidotransferase subunit B